jgi:YggT family protein
MPHAARARNRRPPTGAGRPPPAGRAAGYLWRPARGRQYPGVTSLLSAYTVGYAALRLLVFAAAVVAGAACLLSWLVRTRRVSPFSPVARFVRRTVDPLIAPMERRVVRAGGVPTSAPWWMLVLVVVGGIVVLTLVQFVFAQVVGAAAAASSGPRGILVLVVAWTFGLLQIALLVRVLSSWIGGSPYSPWLRWAFVLTEPILGPLRRIVPTIGMIDITPIVAYFLLRILQGLIVGAL